MPKLLIARDRFLAPDGLIFPDRFDLSIAAITAQCARDPIADAWLGKGPLAPLTKFDLSEGKEFIMEEPVVLHPKDIDARSLLSKICVLRSYDLYSLKLEDTPFLHCFELHGIAEGRFHTFGLFFSCVFSFSEELLGFCNVPCEEQKPFEVRLGPQASPLPTSNAWPVHFCLLKEKEGLEITKGGKIRGVCELKFGVLEELKQMTLQFGLETPDENDGKLNMTQKFYFI